MGKGAVIELLSRGAQDQYFTTNPQITMFKKIWKRHVNFSSESVVVNFDTEPEFGKKMTCTIGKVGDLINRTYLVVTLPKINKFQESLEQPTLNRCAWIENIGYHIIKKIEVEIGGYIIDKQYGEYMYIWAELSRVNNTKRGLDKMIGNVPELLEYSSSKNSYKLHIPLNFWFCNDTSLSLPIVALDFAEVKINVEFAPLNSLLKLAPTHYIDIEEFVVQYNSGDIIYQEINGKKVLGEFIAFDNMITSTDSNPVNRLYYNKIDKTKMVAGLPINSYDGKYEVMAKGAETGHVDRRRNFSWINTLSIKNTYLLVDYIYLDAAERLKFVQENCRYLIDVVQFESDKNITHNSTKLRLGYTNPCREIIIRGQMEYMEPVNRSRYTLDYFGEKQIIKNINIIMNGNVRLSNRESDYFSKIQSFQHHKHMPPNGVFLYSFCLEPNDARQPTGSVNLSKIDDFQINVSVSKEVNYSNPAKIRVYARCYNILTIFNGFGGLKFSN